MKKRSYREHYHFSFGTPCRCPWGHDPEHLGHVKTASKLDWLKERPDMQEGDGAKLLWILNTYWEPRLDEHGDKLLPWLAREWKKKRLLPRSAGVHRFAYNPKGEPLEPEIHEDYGPVVPSSLIGYGGLSDFYPTDLNRMGATLDQMKKYKQGIDVMQHKAHELLPKVKKFEEWRKAKERPDYGEILHKFDDDWTIRRLQNAKEARIEGEDMGHCVGGEHHSGQIERGETVIASLRDHKNLPHATIQITPSYWEDPKDPNAPISYHNKEGWIPRIDSDSVIDQFYGKEDSPPKQEYEDRVNDWLAKHELRAEGAGREPWWEEWYEPEGVDNPHDYLNYEKYEWAPDDYHSACADAEDWGLEPPDLLDPSHDFFSIVESLPYGAKHPYRDPKGRGQRNPTEGYDPHFTEAVLNTADYQNPQDFYDLENEMRRYAQEWTRNLNLDDKYPEMNPWDRYEKIRQEFADDPEYQFVTHVNDLFELNGVDPIREVLQPQEQHPDQTMLFNHPEKMLDGGVGGVGMYQDYWSTPWQQAPEPITYQRYGSADGDIEPLYVRWTHSPTHGVQLSHNGEDHPALVNYHQNLAGDPDKTHGYAYRINNGWRLTNYEHQPVDDPYVVNQVVRALTGKGASQRPGESLYEPIEQDFERLHYGLPVPDDNL